MDPRNHFFTKTLLIETIIDQQIDEDIQVEKSGRCYDINPSYTALVLEQTQYVETLKYLQNGIEDESPSFFE